MFRHLFAFLLVSASAPLLLSGCSAPFEAGCQTDDQCRTGRVCVDSVCQSPDGNNAADNNGDNNMSSNNATVPVNNTTPPVNNTNNVTNNANNTTPNNGTNQNNAPPEHLALCTELCDRLFGSCLEDNCDLRDDQREAFAVATEQCIYRGFDGDPGCLEQAENNPDYVAEVQAQLDVLTCDSQPIAEFQCGELQLGALCGCPTGDTPIGAPCTSGAECASDSLQTFCPAEENEPPFPDGYCAAIGCEFDENEPRARFSDECGDGNVCVPVGEPATAQVGLCLDGCSAHDDCRGGYQCRLVGFERVNGDPTGVRVCLVECSADLPCDGNDTCNGGRCEFSCDQGQARQRCQLLGGQCAPNAAGDEFCQLP